jgi:hypothetical protein
MRGIGDRATPGSSVARVLDAGRARKIGLHTAGAAVVAALAWLLCTATGHAQGFGGIWDNPDGHLGSLAPENLKMDHGKAPIDLTGTWMIFGEWRFLPMPKLKPAAQKLYDEAGKAAKEGKAFNDVTGHCWPPGLPIMMTRVWPIQMIQLPTAVVMISNFENQIRWVFTDGRKHSDPNIYVPSYNGESIGHWEGKTLIIDTTNVETKQHFIDRSVPISDKFHVVEYITLKDNGNVLSDEFHMTDPENWEGEWVSTKTYRRQTMVDFLEVHCLPDLDQGIPATFDQYSASPEKGN